jgi:hypothetical protein
MYTKHSNSVEMQISLIRQPRDNLDGIKHGNIALSFYVDLEIMLYYIIITQYGFVTLLHS